ncbi:hypothetical protein JHW43_007430 [Diplocarpon mali]|nr:hypothetical protein JHW43_007430 [Diplocarpon mali]
MLASRATTTSEVTIGMNLMWRSRSSKSPLRVMTQVRFSSTEAGQKIVSPHVGFYKTFTRPIAKVLLMATFTYQLTYWGWVYLEKAEIKKEKTEIKVLENQLSELTQSKETKKTIARGASIRSWCATAAAEAGTGAFRRAKGILVSTSTHRLQPTSSWLPVEKIRELELAFSACVYTGAVGWVRFLGLSNYFPSQSSYDEHDQDQALNQAAREEPDEETIPVRIAGTAMTLIHALIVLDSDPLEYPRIHRSTLQYSLFSEQRSCRKCAKSSPRLRAQVGRLPERSVQATRTSWRLHRDLTGIETPLTTPPNLAVSSRHTSVISVLVSTIGPAKEALVSIRTNEALESFEYGGSAHPIDATLSVMIPLAKQSQQSRNGGAWSGLCNVPWEVVW